MLDTTLKAQLKSYLQRLQRPIELQARLDAGASSQELRALLADIVECSENNMVTLREVAADGKRAPSFAIAPAGEAPRVEFAGLPMGHEFSSLVLALLQVGGHPVREEEHVLQGIAKLQGERNFEVYISLSCHNCPDVVQALNAMAVLNPGIKVTTVDGALFQDEVTQREVMAVPSVFLNGKPFVSGRIGMQELLERLDEGAAEAQAQRMQEQDPFDVLVVGAGPAGVAAAVYAARKGIRTGMVAQRIGGQTNDTVGIENYISVLETTGAKFSADLQAHVRRYGVEVMEGHQVERLVPPAQVGGLHEVHLANKAVLRARSVVLAPGARWRNMDVPGEAEYKNKGVAYCPHCDGPLFKGKPVAVIGGGNSGVEAAIDLAGVVKHVTVLEYGDSLKADAVLVAKLKSLPNVQVLTQARTTAVLGDGARVHALSYEDRATGQAHQVDLQGVFVQIGLVPNTEFLKGVVELSARGEIEVDSHGRTNVPGVFAAGDATTAVFKQIVIAAGDGAKASLSAFDYLIRTPAQQAAVEQQVQALAA